MELFGIVGTKQTQYMFFGASQNDLCRSGGYGSKGRLEGCIVTWQRGCNLPSGASNCNNYCTFLPLSAFLHVQNGSDMVQTMSWFQALSNSV